MGIYEKTLKERDSFIRAAINANDDFMKEYWLHLAETANTKLNDLSEKSVYEVENE